CLHGRLWLYSRDFYRFWVSPLFENREAGRTLPGLFMCLGRACRAFGLEPTGVSGGGMERKRPGGSFGGPSCGAALVFLGAQAQRQSLARQPIKAPGTERGEVTPMSDLEQIIKLVRDLAGVDEKKLLSFQAHGFRVMYLACKLGRRMGVYDADLRLAALLHDIGKIGVDSAILFKPGPLNHIEYLIIQAHSHIGNRIVRELLDRPRAAEFIRDHHERWDGRGYPRGLAGDAIPVQSQIISVCDAFDTITVERRVYQAPPMRVADALNEIRQCAGKQFGPRVAREFVEMIRHSPLRSDDHEWYRGVEEYLPLLHRRGQ